MKKLNSYFSSLGKRIPLLGLVLITLVFSQCKVTPPIDTPPVNPPVNGPKRALSLGNEELSGEKKVFDLLNLQVNNPCVEVDVKKADLVLHLDYGEEYTLGQKSDLTANLVVNVSGYSSFSSSATPIFTHANVSLEISENAPEMQIRINFLEDYKDVLFHRIEIVEYDAADNLSANNRIRFKAYVSEERISKATDTDAPSNQLLSLKKVNTSTFPATFSWSSGCGKMPNYEIQLMRIYPEDELQSNPLTASFDWSEALTVETGSDAMSFKLHPAEGTGNYIWRVRPIGNWYKNGAANPMNWGRWCGAIQASDPFGIDTLQISPNQELNYFYFEDSNEDKNWIYNRSFNEGNAEEIAIRDGVSFANGLGFEVQNQQRLESTNQVVTSQRLYDYTGRESLVTLSAPLTANDFTFKQKLVKSHDGSIYSPKDFDADNTLNDPQPMVGELTDYYDQNEDPAISRIQEYPFSRTIFLNDPSGRPKEVSQPSEHLNIQSEKTTKTYFSQADDMELLRVFGNEAPKSERVYKRTVVNPDGVASVSYFEGDNLIATCLQATGQQKVDSLQKEVTTYVGIIGGNKEGTLREKASFTLVSPKVLSLNYQITPALFKDACISFCEKCKYQVEVLIRKTDELGEKKVLFQLDTVVSPQSCRTTSSLNWSRKTLDPLPPGTYDIERIITALDDTPSGEIEEWEKQFDKDAESQMTELYKELESDNLETFYDYLDNKSGVTYNVQTENYNLPTTSCLNIEIPKMTCEEEQCTDVNIGNYSAVVNIPTTDLGASPTEINAWANQLHDSISCNKLWSCWTAIVDGYPKLKELTDSMNNGVFPIDFPESEADNDLPTGSGLYPDIAINLWEDLKRCLGFEATNPLSELCDYDPLLIEAGDESEIQKLEACIAANGGFQQATQSQIQELMIRTESVCESRCENFRDLFFSQVKEAYLNSGYEIIAIDTRLTVGQKKVSWLTISRQVECLIADCKQGCSVELEKVGRLPIAVNYKDEARFVEVMTKMPTIKLSNGNFCPKGYRKVESYGEKLAATKLSYLIYEFVNPKVQETINQINGKKYFHIGSFLSEIGYSLGCNNDSVALYPKDRPYDYKFPNIQLREQYFAIEDCDLFFISRSTLSAKKQLICTSICDSVSCVSSCIRWKGIKFPQGNGFTPKTCEQKNTDELRGLISAQFYNFKAEKREELLAKHESKCLNNIDDRLMWSYEDARYHYTLYYYDRAGNLVKTVPPEGVNYLTSNETSELRQLEEMRKTAHDHRMVTEYEYNSLGQQVAIRTPDGGEMTLAYDRKLRLRATQDASQKANANFGYIKYDDLNRLIELGESDQFAGLWGTNSFTNELDKKQFPTVGTERTFMVYSEEKDGLNYNGETQKHLQNRISYTYNDDGASTAYSYDPHGNVAWMSQKQGVLGEKFVGYDYDLISGKVREVKYNEGKPDAFYHRYTYDADNRLTGAQTSSDGILWDRDATYSYLEHGPLRRVELGEDRIQGIDHYYASSGVLKAINGFELEQGEALTSSFAQDVWGTQLNYFQGDYDHASGKFAQNLENGQHDLHSGRITGVICRADQPVNNTPGQLARIYRYDEANRLVASNAFTSDFSPTDQLATRYQYDGNGNILQLNRNKWSTDQSVKMDELSYDYPKNNQNQTVNNRLKRVEEAIETLNIEYDLENQPIGNYAYDEVGRLTKDLSNDIQNIEWTSDDKVRKITKSDSEISFLYDPLGNRIKKMVGKKGDLFPKVTYYIRGANSEVLSMYEQVGLMVTKTLKQTEIPIISGSRIGIFNANRTVLPPKETAYPTYTREIGKKHYELSDHLGNTRAVVTDVKDSTTDGSFKAQVVSTAFYYPFGMTIPAFSVSSESYRYGFNGMEKDDEIKGEGNSYTSHFRQYDPRVARWLSIDPKFTASESPYVSMRNNPVEMVDPKGDSSWFPMLPLPKLQELGTNSQVNYTYKNDESFLPFVNSVLEKIADNNVYQLYERDSGRRTGGRTALIDYFKSKRSTAATSRGAWFGHVRDKADDDDVIVQMEIKVEKVHKLLAIPPGASTVTTGSHKSTTQASPSLHLGLTGSKIVAPLGPTKVAGSNASATGGVYSYEVTFSIEISVGVNTDAIIFGSSDYEWKTKTFSVKGVLSSPTPRKIDKPAPKKAPAKKK